MRKFHLVFSSNITFDQVRGPAVAWYFEIDLQIHLSLIIMHIALYFYNKRYSFY